jgi:hypothetical protein
MGIARLAYNFQKQYMHVDFWIGNLIQTEAIREIDIQHSVVIDI